MFFFFFSDEDNKGVGKENDAILELRKNRQDVLELEAKLLVLRLLQLRDFGGKTIKSVRQNNVELPKLQELQEVVLSELSIERIHELSAAAGYSFGLKIPGTGLSSKINIEVNGNKYGIRCFDHTERPLINHSTREKYERLCNKVGVNIEALDNAVDHYWECREAGVFNEDCAYNTPLNPFLDIKDELRTLLTYIAFHSYNIKKEENDPSFELEKIDGYIDYVNPCDESTWDVLDEEQFFDKVWKHLRFSFRADRGMPHGGKQLPLDNSILRWTRQWTDKHGDTVYKGALHIRICKYDTAINDTPFEELFTIKYQEEIKEVTVNQGDKDEYLLKLFLVECRKYGRSIPIGDEFQEVKKVENPKREEIGYPRKKMNWDTISPSLLVFICQGINAGKSGAFDKADVFVNGIGISVKSKRGAASSIINQTSREKILRVMRVLNAPILPLDQIINRYWFLRLNGGTEDVFGIGQGNPFTTNEDGSSNMPIMKPLLNYFAFKGTGTRDSTAPATYILSVGKPDDTATWEYYSENNFVESLWEKFAFSIRSKGLPKVITEEMEPWIKEINDEKIGTLNVRVKK